jgi:hypothetical protein
MAAALAAGALGCACAAPGAEAADDAFPAAAGQGMPSVTLAVLPSTDDMADLAGVRGLALGELSAGIGTVSPEQLFLDISQGNRVDDALYDHTLPRLGPFTSPVPGWGAIVDRAEGAPADLVPGLLASTLLDSGIPVRADPHRTESALIAVDRSGVVRRFTRPGCSYRRRCSGLVVLPANLHKFKGLAYGIRDSGTEGIQGDDLLIGITLPDSDGSSVIGIEAAGYYHDLRADWTRDLISDSTRTDGFVLSTDLAPTILSRFGIPIPDEMDGEPIRPGAEDDRPAVIDRVHRVVAIPERRGPDVVLPLVAWILIAFGVAIWRPQFRGLALSWLAVAFAYMPLMLLAGAAMRPNGFAEAMLIWFAAGVLAALTVLLIRGWWALAIACAITVIAYAIDVLSGSDLTRLSLLGPNPLFGVRFYGIGNELEALIAVMVPVAVGAGLTAAGERRPLAKRTAVAAFLVAGVIAGLLFGAGRFGADVGAAIVLPVGAAVAAASLPRSFEGFARYSDQNSSKRNFGRIVAAAVTAPIVALAFLAFIDLVSGGNAHLTRSVFDAGGAGDLADVAERRLRLSAHDFAQAAGNPLFWVVVVGIAATISQRRRIDAWLKPVPAARAGVIGACAAVAVGVLVNDSGATFLTLGALGLGAALCFAWAQAPGTKGA